MMKVSIKNLPKSKIELKIEISTEDMERFRKETILNLGKELKIEGFRPGHLPTEIIEKEIGQEKILKEATERAINENYRQAILENNIIPLGQPEVEIIKMVASAPLEFKVKISVLPEIKLPDYQKIASVVRRKEISVTESEVDESLSWLQKSRAKFSQKLGPCQKGDFIEIEYSSPQLESRKRYRDSFILGQGYFLKNFEENLEGLNSGEEKEFLFQFPEDYSQKELAGKKTNFEVQIKSVQKIELPEIDDKFAQNLGHFENLSTLKQSVRKGLNLEKEKAETERLRQEILERISQQTIFETPEFLIELEKNKILEDLKIRVDKNLKISFKDYLTKINKSGKELLDTFSNEAEKRVKNSLVLREISKKENIEVPEEEIKEEVNKILKSYQNIKMAEKEFDPVRNKFLNGVDLEKLKEYTKQAIQNVKTLQLLESFTQK